MEQLARPLVTHTHLEFPVERRTGRRQAARPTGQNASGIGPGESPGRFCLGLVAGPVGPKGQDGRVAAFCRLFAELVVQRLRQFLGALLNLSQQPVPVVPLPEQLSCNVQGGENCHFERGT